jgi:hypothetical protein
MVKIRAVRISWMNQNVWELGVAVTLAMKSSDATNDSLDGRGSGGIE